VLRSDGTLAQTIAFGVPREQRVRSADVAIFAQDRWQPLSQVLLEMGVRLDRDGVLGRQNLAPRLGAVLALTSDGRIAVRGGFGMFYERTPSAAGAFDASETRTITRLGSDGLTPLGVPVVYTPRAEDGLQTARSYVWNAEYEHRVTRQITLRGNFLERQGTHALIETPTPPDDGTGRAALLLSSSGRSFYREAGVSVNYVSGADREVSVSYLRSASWADLNAYSVESGLLPDPVVHANEYAPMGADAPNRLVARASGGLGGKVRLSGTLELRNGFPYSPVDEQQDFVGPRNQGWYFPTVARTDLAIEYRFTIHGWHPWLGVRFWNAFNAFLPQDVQRNVGSPAFGSFFNQLPRLIRFTVRIQR
jgi:hypothetical protein